MQKVAATESDRNAWKWHRRLMGIWCWCCLIPSAIITIWTGVLIAGGIVNGIRDWWHYHQSSQNLGVTMLVFAIAGAIWFFSKVALDEMETHDAFDRYVERRRRDQAANEKLAKQRAKSWKWQRFIVIPWLILVGFGLLMAILAG